MESHAKPYAVCIAALVFFFRSEWPLLFTDRESRNHSGPRGDPLGAKGLGIVNHGIMDLAPAYIFSRYVMDVIGPRR